MKIHSGLAIRVRRSLGAVNAKVKFDTEGQAERELWDADLPAIAGERKSTSVRTMCKRAGVLQADAGKAYRSH